MALTFEIKEEIGKLSTGKWNKELNLVAWNGGNPKYDIRDWSAEHDRMGKGITFTQEELLALKNLLNEMKI